VQILEPLVAWAEEREEKAGKRKEGHALYHSAHGAAALGNWISRRR
jgi:hypothetical protein